MKFPYSKSGYIGVYWHHLGKRWAAQIRNGKRIEYLGLFEDKLSAAKAYDKRARELNKQFLNFVDPNDQTLKIF